MFMKINRVCVCLNSSPLYTRMWDIFSEVYTKTTDIIPTLFFCGTEEELDNEVKNNFGEVILLERFPEVIVNPALDWSVIWSLFWGIANYFPKEVCMISGVDDLPMSNIIWKSMEHIPDDKFVIPLGDNPYDIASIDKSVHLIANGYTTGTGEVIKKLFNIDDNLRIELNKVWSNKHSFASKFPSNHANLAGWQRWWGMDEAYISTFVHGNSNVVFFDNEWVIKNIKDKKIDRATNFHYDIEKVKNGKYPFAHIPRPLTDTENMEKVSTLLKHMGVWL